ncbi:MAG: hypothetical protein NT087_13105 [Deltaproteobacteria bacterium]|nr:hypothetical protein [Deltaproteobacteria bacterium]
MAIAYTAAGQAAPHGFDGAPEAIGNAGVVIGAAYGIAFWWWRQPAGRVPSTTALTRVHVVITNQRESWLVGDFRGDRVVHGAGSMCQAMDWRKNKGRKQKWNNEAACRHLFALLFFPSFFL